MKQRNRIAALVTAGIMALSLFPGNALAAEPEPAEGEQTCVCETLCTEGSIDENCLVCAADPTQCLGMDTPDTEGGEAGDEPEQSEGMDDIDPAVTDVQALIDALPTAEELESMSQDEQAAVYEQVQAAYDVYMALTDEQQAQINGAKKFDALFAVFNGMVNTLADNTDVSSGPVTITTNGNYTITGTTTTNTITVNSGVTATITLNNVNIDLSSGSGTAFDIQSGANVTLILEGTNTLTSGAVSTGNSTGAPGIHLPSGASLTIQGSGSLSVTGGSSYSNNGGAGIGGNVGIGQTDGEACGTVVILGGTVQITGGSTTAGTTSGVGIGGGSTGSILNRGGSGGTVVILGGNVTVNGGGGNAADIGGGSGVGNHNGATGQGIRPDTDGTYEVYGDLTLPEGVTIPSGVTVTVPNGASLTIPEGTTVPGNITVETGGTLENHGTVTGSITNNGGTIIAPANVSVTASPNPATPGSNVTLTANVANASDGTVTFYRGTASGTRIGTGTITGTSNGVASCQVTLDSTSWPTSGSPYTITAVYSGGTGLLGNSGTATLTVTLPNADIQLTVKNGNSTTNEFTYGDTITIEGTVTEATAANGVNTNAITQDQVGLFLGDTQLGNTATVGSDGSFTLSYNTTNKGIIPGTTAQTLTVRYGGSTALSSGSETVQITLNKKEVTVSLGGTTTKVYDGTTNAPTGLTIGLTGVLNADTVNAQAASVTYNNADVGTNKTITASGITLGGAHAAYYTLSNTTATTTGSITAAAASVDTAPAAVQNLTYTGGDQALVTAGAASNGTMVYALGDNAATAPESSSFSAAIPQGTDAGAYYVWYKVQGDLNHSDTAPACVTVTIAKKELTVSATANDKTYDGTTTAIGTVTLTGAVNGEQPTADGAFAFESADAGANKQVNVTNIALTGTWDTNYTLDVTSTATTADIAKATPTLSLTASSASLTGGGDVVLTLSGLPSGETATVTCNDSTITVTANGGGSWTAENLPNQTRDYTFTAAFAGNDNYEAAAADCTVAVTYQSTGGGYVPTRPWRPSRPVEPEEPESPVLNGWIQEDGVWYLYQGGSLATGWNRYNGTWYYLDSNGRMLTGWQKLNGTWYYLHSWGGMATGWLNLGGTWYYLKDWGGMATGWLNLNGTWYYLRDWGGMATGWLNLNGTWYYLYDWGGMAANTTTPDGYRVGPSGAWIQ